MGWISYHVDTYTRNGKLVIDRKKECDAELTSGIGKNSKILESAMVGSTYYAAVQSIEPDGSYQVGAVVFRTCFDRNSEDNFSYKPMDETMGLAIQYCKCPLSILKLLTETSNKYALDWRKSCMEYHEALKTRAKLRNYPVGSKITFINQEKFMDDIIRVGERVCLVKCPGINGRPAYWSDGVYRWRTRFIPGDHELIVKREEDKYAESVHK